MPQALLRSGVRSANAEMEAAGLQALDWLVTIQRSEEKGHFVPIGSQGFYSRKTEKARFDQQPVEACAVVSACLQAYGVTGKGRWRKEAWSAFNWFLGDNDLQIALYDPSTGGYAFPEYSGLWHDGFRSGQGEWADSCYALLRIWGHLDWISVDQAQYHRSFARGENKSTALF